MDWSVFAYFLAAVVAAGVSYAVWPKSRRSQINVANDRLSGETPQEDEARYVA